MPLSMSKAAVRFGMSYDCSWRVFAGWLRWAGRQEGRKRSRNDIDDFSNQGAPSEARTSPNTGMVLFPTSAEVGSPTLRAGHCTSRSVFASCLLTLGIIERVSFETVSAVFASKTNAPRHE